jgi:replicative DNA helicase
MVRLLAFHMAEGEPTGSSPNVTDLDPEIVNDYCSAVQESFPGVPNWAFGHANPVKTWLGGLGLWGRGAEHARFPQCVWAWDRERLAEFIKALMSCDGTVQSMAGHPQIEFAVASESLAQDMHHALVRLGIVARLWKKKDRCWRVEITEPRSVARYQQDIGWIGERSRRFTAEPPRPGEGDQPYAREPAAPQGFNVMDLARRANEAHADVRASRGITQARLATYADVMGDFDLRQVAGPDIYWDEVVSIEATGDHQVYDLSVPETHNFIAQDILVHNTSLALNIALHSALEGKKSVAIFSLEMSKEQLTERLLTEQAQIDAQRMHRGLLTEAEFDRVSNALGPLGEAAIFIDDTPVMDELTLQLKARQAKMRHGIDMILIDYLQLMHGRTRGDDNRVQEVSSISRALKGLARELRIPVIALSQLSRAPEQRPDKRPILSDLRESGCLAGETPVYLPDTGSSVPIRELVGRTGFRVLAHDANGPVLTSKRVTNSFSTGAKPVFRLVTQFEQNSIRATANHKFLTRQGWRRLDQIAAGDEIATVDAWDSVGSIEPDGVEEVFDLTVEDLHNFVANNVIVHNSIEQDSDVVMFLFRPEYYKSDERPGIAELIVAKHRNGPTGTIELKFRRDHTRFYNLETRRPEPGTE